MKKELRILVILIAVLLVGTVGYYFMPKKFGKNVNPSEVDHINVFDGNTGTGFTITDSEDIEYIVANIQGISMKRDNVLRGLTEEETRLCIRVFDKICNNAEEYLREYKENTNENF